MIDPGLEIGSPYNRKKDALMGSDDEDQHSKNGYQEDNFAKLPYSLSIGVSPMRPLINLQPMTESSTANVFLFKDAPQNFFINGNVTALMPNDNTAFQIGTFQ